MPDTRSNRGAHPQDPSCFGSPQLAKLLRATDDLCWLLDRGYPTPASAQLVGDRHRLRARQRTAVQRCAAGHEICERRAATRVEPSEVAGEELLVDGYNVLLSVEAALGGGVILRARDTTVRDMAAMSGHYRKVLQTPRALELVGRYLSDLGASAHWLLDRPVSNSGRLRSLMEATARKLGWRWRVELVPNPDPVLARSTSIVATADSGILDRGPRWLNLAALVIEEAVPDAWVVDLSGQPGAIGAGVS